MELKPGQIIYELPELCAVEDLNQIETKHVVIRRNGQCFALALDREGHPPKSFGAFYVHVTGYSVQGTGWYENQADAIEAAVAEFAEQRAADQAMLTRFQEQLKKTKQTAG